MGPDHASQLTVPSSLNQMTQQNAICKGLFHATAVAQINTLLLQPFHQSCMAPGNTSQIRVGSIHVVLIVQLCAAFGSFVASPDYTLLSGVLVSHASITPAQTRFSH